jgi:hypothetical protein
MEHISACLVTSVNKMLDLIKFKAYGCQPTGFLANDNRVCITECGNIQCQVHRWYSHFWCEPQSPEWRLCPFPDGIWHSNDFCLVSTRECQTSHQQCRISLFLWCFQGDSPVEHHTLLKERFSWPPSLTELKYLPLFSVGGRRYLMGRVFQKNLQTILELKTATQQENEAILQKLNQSSK